jgi:hypothetical protein
MFANLISTTNKFYADKVLIFITFGGFGRYVLTLLRAEFKRLGIPGDKAHFLAFDTEKTHRDRLDLNREKEYLIHLEGFDGDVYIKSKENESLKKVVSHIPANVLCDIEGGGKDIPAAGFVSFHKYYELLIRRHALWLIDDVRQKNPGKKVKLILISGMGGSVSNGMSVPFLYQIGNHIKDKQISVEVFLATSEGYLGLQNILEESVERNCVASAMLWEYAMAGRNGLTYPGKRGEGRLSMFDDKIANRTYVFSGGSAETSLKYPAIASIMAQCICTLELTTVGSYLSRDRANYFSHILERQWRGKAGGQHPTGLMTMNVAGLKGDCLPQLYHFYMVRRFIEEVTGSLDFEEKESIDGKVLSWFLRNHLKEDEILSEFGIDLPVLSPKFIKQMHLNQETVHDILNIKIDELNARALKVFEKKKNHEVAALMIGNVIDQLKRSGESISATPNQYMKGALLFYEKAASLLNKKLSNVSKSILRIEADLFEENQQATLRQLLEKLKSGSKKKGNNGGIAVTLATSSTVTLVARIIEIAADIQQKKIDKYNLLLLHNIYQTLYDAVMSSMEKQKTALYKYNKLLSEVDRNAANIIRVSRSAFTYNRSEFEALTHWIMERLYEKLDHNSTQEIIQQLGKTTIMETISSEQELIETLLGIVRPDIDAISECVDRLYCKEPRVVEYLKSCLDRFFLTIRLDRNRFPTLETNQSHFVMCTKGFYDAYKDALFEGFCHIETDNPFNVIVSRHEEGFPFHAISYMSQINQDYKELQLRGESGYGHIMSELDMKLPMLDA